MQLNPDEKPIIFRKFIAFLKAKQWGETSLEIRKLNARYFKHRKEAGFTYFYDGTNKTNIIAKAADTYEVNLANNVRDHMYNRIKTLFNLSLTAI